tara:strand:+ start:4628 stop:5044 length:417 start_codon:yes stop_codon:yes gene_type:complete
MANSSLGEPGKELKPWYYQDWFLFPSFVFWPLWSVLTIRSPWHNGFISGALSWALIFMGIYLLVYQALFLGEGISRQGAITFIIPGVALTVITQIHWTFVQKPKISRNLGSMVTTQHEEEDSGSKPRSRRARNRKNRR